MSNEEYLISLLGSVLNRKPVQMKPQNIDFEKVFELACKHNVQSAAFYGIERSEQKPDEKIYAGWKEKYHRDVVKSIKQLRELSEISSLFSENHIVHLPLKGCVLKKMYERADMRTMADMDILIDPADEIKVKNLLCERGYTCTSYGKTHHDVYKKEPIYNIEIHISLFKKQDVEYYRYYDKFLQRTLAGENEYARIMSDEDFYVYNIAHFGRHFEKSGSGIRSVMDVYVMRKAFENHMDRSYVENALSQLNLLEFEKNVTDLSEYWFGDGVYKAELKNTASYIIGSGTYGTLSNMVNNQIKSEGKFKCLIKSAFLPYDIMAAEFPALKKAPFLLPLFWVWRVIIAIIKRPKRVAYRIKAVAKAMLKKTPPKG